MKSTRQPCRPSNVVARSLLLPINRWTARTACPHHSLPVLASRPAATGLQSHLGTTAGCTHASRVLMVKGCPCSDSVGQQHANIGPCTANRRARRRAVVRAGNDKGRAETGQDESKGGAAGPEAGRNSLVNIFQTAWREAVQEADAWDPAAELKKQEQLWEQHQRMLREGPQAMASDKETQQEPRSKSSSAAAEQVVAADEAVQQLPLYKRPWLTWAMCAWTWLLLLQQWWPLLGALTTPASSWSEVVLRVSGVALLVPDTPASNQWQLDMIRWLSGGAGSWAAPIAASFMHSGLLPTWVFTCGLLDVGSSIEGIYAQLVMVVHVVCAAYGAALMQLLFSPVPCTITGPGMVCGLYVGMAVMLFREKQTLRQITSNVRSSKEVLGSTAGSNDTAEALRPEDVQGFLELPTVTRSALVTWALALLLAVFQPMLGIWGVLGGCLGGLVAGLCGVFVVFAMRWTAWTLLKGLSWLLGNVLRVPLLLLNAAIAVCGGFARAVQDFVSGFRQL